MMDLFADGHEPNQEGDDEHGAGSDGTGRRRRRDWPLACMLHASPLSTWRITFRYINKQATYLKAPSRAQLHTNTQPITYTYASMP